LEHLQVAVGVAEGGDGPPADGFARLVVDKVESRQAHQHGLTVAQREAGLDAAADDLIRPGAHKFDAAASGASASETARLMAIRRWRLMSLAPLWHHLISENRARGSTLKGRPPRPLCCDRYWAPDGLIICSMTLSRLKLAAFMRGG
jgi:hypothetical protein